MLVLLPAQHVDTAFVGQPQRFTEHQVDALLERGHELLNPPSSAILTCGRLFTVLNTS